MITYLRSAFLLFVAVVAGATASYAQKDTSSADLASLLNDDKGATNAHDYTSATFKCTRIINGSSVENLGEGILDFRILHRFGQLNQGASNFYGLDDATTKLSLDYGIKPWLMVGLGHTTYKKMNDGYAKVRILRQEKYGAPVTITYQGSVSEETDTHPVVPAGDTYYFTNRLSFCNQVLVARKFNERLSLQITPTIVHYNIVDSTKYKSNTFAVGVGGRIKVTRRIAVTGEYYWVVPGTEQYYINSSGNEERYHNALALGVDIETGGHVFQLHFTNCTAMTETEFVGRTHDDWSKGEIHFGFNISRVFTIRSPKEFKNSRNNIY